jgi:hypothetical protein
LGLFILPGKQTCLITNKYTLEDALLLRSHCIKDLGVHTDCKLNSDPAYFLFPRGMKLFRVNSQYHISLFHHRQATDAVFALATSEIEKFLLRGSQLRLRIHKNLKALQRKFEVLCHNIFFKTFSIFTTIY